MAEPYLLLAPGALITDRLVVVRQLGSGGLGVVYEVEHKFTKHRRAVKVLHPRFRTDKDITERLLREASAAGRIGNPHIVETFDAGYLDDGSPYLVMELIEGRPLNEVLRWNGRLDAGLAAALMVQVATAVQAAHDAGIVHRDLKPDNLFLTERDGAAFTKVLDFGVSKFAGDDDVRQTRSGITMGTPLYMAPEQLKGAKNADARSDVYSLGVILFEMLSGHVPFQANSFAELAVKVLSDDVPPLSVTGSGVPEPLANIVRRALDKEPSNRFQTAAELRDALQPLAQNHEIKKLLEEHPEPPPAPVAVESVPLTAHGPHEDTYKPKKKPVAAAPLGPMLQLLAAFAALGIAAATGVWLFARPATATLQSIAVLPFDNATGDPETDWLGDGLSESVIYQLSRGSSLKVMPRSSAARAKAATTTPAEAGEKLGVDAVLTAELAPRHLLRAELIDVRTGALLWGNRWDTEVVGLIAIQRELAEGARAALEHAEPGRAAPQQPTDADAYRAYLKGRYYWNKRTAEGLEKAAALFKEALDTDPSFALAWVGLADSVALMDQYAGVPSGENCPKAKAAIARALALDAELATAHATRGLLLGHCDFAWPEAQAELEKAIALDQNYATAHQWFALHLAYRGLFDEALEQARIAEKLDPLSLIAGNAVSVVSGYAGHWDVALKQSDRLVALDASFPVAHMWKGRALRAKGELGPARTELEKAFALADGRSFELMGELGATAALANDRREAEKWKARLEEALAKNASVSFHLAAVCAALGETDAAFEHLERAFEKGSWFLTQLNDEPLFEPLRADPRFTALAKRAKLL